MQRALVTGGLGFAGSHLCESLLEDGYEVVALDNLFTGERANVARVANHPGLRVVEAHQAAHRPVRRTGRDLQPRVSRLAAAISASAGRYHRKVHARRKTRTGGGQALRRNRTSGVHIRGAWRSVVAPSRATRATWMPRARAVVMTRRRRAEPVAVAAARSGLQIGRA